MSRTRRAGPSPSSFPPARPPRALSTSSSTSGGRGAIKPEAKLEPVEIGGVMVSQATMHNEDFIASRDLRIGDTVVVKRAGDVIPQVVKAVVEARTGEEKVWQMPERCPACDTELVRLPGEAERYCLSSDCPAQFIRLVEHYAGRGAMDIEGLGEKMAVLLVEQNLIRHLADLYRLEPGRSGRAGGLCRKTGAEPARGHRALQGTSAEPAALCARSPPRGQDRRRTPRGPV